MNLATVSIPDLRKMVETYFISWPGGFLREWAIKFANSKGTLTFEDKKNIQYYAWIAFSEEGHNQICNRWQLESILPTEDEVYFNE